MRTSGAKASWSLAHLGQPVLCPPRFRPHTGTRAHNEVPFYASLPVGNEAVFSLLLIHGNALILWKGC